MQDQGDRLWGLKSLGQVEPHTFFSFTFLLSSTGPQISVPTNKCENARSGDRLWGLRTGRREEGTTGRRLVSKRGAAQVAVSTAAALVTKSKIVPRNSCLKKEKS